MATSKSNPIIKFLSTPISYNKAIATAILGVGVICVATNFMENDRPAASLEVKAKENQAHGSGLVVITNSSFGSVINAPSRTYSVPIYGKKTNYAQ